jgi:hypothetical protein
MLRDEAKLTEILRSLGAPEPEMWARSQAEEGINQLGRFLFLRQAWRELVSDEDASWVTRMSKAPGSDEPGGGAGPTVRRLLADGAAPADIAALSRVVQWELLHRLCYLLDDPGEGADHIAWGLFEVDEHGEPTSVISGLHESVLETDSLGREMRPLPAQLQEPGKRS